MISNWIINTIKKNEEYVKTLPKWMRENACMMAKVRRDEDRLDILDNATEKEIRRLATVRTVAALEPLKNSDFLEVATIDGWQCVVSKNDNLRVGDKVVYFEIDSIVPSDNPVFSFMETKSYKVKTIKLRGQISQGLAMPLHLFPNVSESDDDVTEKLGVTKAIGKTIPCEARGSFPHFIPKTDEERIQNAYGVLSRYFTDDLKWVATEKLDGSSMTVYLRDDEYGVCSRNLDLKLDGSNPFVNLATSMKLEDKMRMASACDSVPDNFAIQGELVGPGIQGNRYDLKEHRLYAFNIYDIDSKQYLGYHDFCHVCRMLGIYTVEEVLFNVILTNETVQEIVTMSTAKSLLNSKVWAEGLVFRTMTEMRDPRYGRLSFKCINPQFLLTEK